MSAASGLVSSIRHEDGTFDTYDYSLVSNLWVRTVTHLHEQSPTPVSGKTTRDITTTNHREGRIWVIHRTTFPTGSFHFVLNSDASQSGLRYRSAFASHNTSAVRWQHLRRFQSWGSAPNPECKQVSCGFSSVRGVGRSPTLKIRALRNMLIGSTARSMRRSGNGAIFASLRS